MAKYYFTFGCGQEHAGHYVELEGTMESTRNRMFDLFGRRWSFQYSEDEWTKDGVSQVERWGYKKLEVTQVYYFTHEYGNNDYYTKVYAISESVAINDFCERFGEIDYNIYNDTDWHLPDGITIADEANLTELV